MTKPYCGVGKLPKGYHRGNMKECAELGQIRYWGLKKADSKIIEASKKKITRGVTAKTRTSAVEEMAGLRADVSILEKKLQADNLSEKKKTSPRHEFSLSQVVKEIPSTLTKQDRRIPVSTGRERWHHHILVTVSQFPKLLLN